MIRCIRSRWRWWREKKRLEDDALFLGIEEMMRGTGRPSRDPYVINMARNFQRKYAKMEMFQIYRKMRKQGLLK